MSRKRKIILFTLCFLSFCGTKILSAQPFSYLEIGGSLSSPSLQDESYSSRWALTDAYSIQLRLPYYKRLIIGLEVTYFDYKEKAKEYSDIFATNYSALIGINAFRNHSLNVFLGTDVGIQKTWLLDDEFKSNPDERELYYSVIVEPQISVSKVIIFGSVKYQKIFNYRRQHIFYVGTGFRFRVNLPNKLQDFIK